MRFKIALFKDGFYVQGRVFYISTQGDYEMFHAWSLGMLLGTFIYDSI